MLSVPAVRNDEIADILTALASIMRYNTKKPNLLVPVSQEIEMTRQYETIQKACYEESLEFCYELDEEAMAVLVPKQILQPWSKMQFCTVWM